MGTMTLVAALANAMMDALDATINAGTGVPTLDLHAGSVGSAAPATGPTGPLLQKTALGDPALGASTVTGSGANQVAKLTLNADTPAAVTASGTAGCFAIKHSDGTLMMKGDCGATGSGAMLELSSTTIAGAGVNLTEANCVLTLPLTQTV